VKSLFARSALAAAAALLLNGAMADAQNLHRQKFWIEFGGGPAAIRINCTGCDDVTRATGSASFLRLGGTLSEKVLLGAEFFGFSDQSFEFDSGAESVLAEFASISASVLWYPWRSHFFIKSGVGIAEGLFTVDPLDPESAKSEGVGVGLTYGLGLDVPISRKLAFSLNASTYFTAVGDLVLPHRTVEDVIPTTYMVSIGVVLR
jgi:hypothetical protein